MPSMMPNTTETFLSTPSARRATAYQKLLKAIAEDFYPRPPRGGRPAGPPREERNNGISIHALREEGDQRGHQFL